MAEATLLRRIMIDIIKIDTSLKKTLNVPLANFQTPPVAVYSAHSVSAQQMFGEKRLKINCEIALRVQIPLNTSDTHDQCSTLFRPCRDKVLLGSVLIDFDMLPGIFRGKKTLYFKSTI